jgi:Flp pilus assembly protein CpaB
VIAVSLGIGLGVGRTFFAETTVVKEEPIVVGSFDTVSVPVPIEPVKAGSLVRDVRFKLVQYPKHQLPEGAITNVESRYGAYVTRDLPAALPLFEANLSLGMPVHNPVAERIPDGMRAMTVNVDVTSAVEGWAGSGSLVDVLLITPKGTRVIAEKVKILSTERIVAAVDGSASPEVPSTATLLVTQEQCLTISTAIPHGKISFVLRNTKDDGEWTNVRYAAGQLHSGIEPVAKSKMQGYIAMKDEQGGKKSYALRDGEWTKVQEAPAGFFER